MRLLIEVSGQIRDWHRAFTAAADRPRLPLAFSSSGAFVARGHEVSAINFSDQSFTSCEKGKFHKLYGPRELRRALIENDIAFFWAGSGIKAIISNFRRLPERKVLLASYVWRPPQIVTLKVQLLALATRFAARYSRAVVLMTEEQKCQALSNLRATVPVVRFTWGIDSAFYRYPSTETDVSLELQRDLGQLIEKPYFILAGDQQRLDADAVDLVEKFDLRLVRVPQEPTTAAWYRRQISERGLKGRLFIFERVTYRTLRFLLQHAVAYVGLVDSKWQPAGWTVLSEALASGTPAIVYDGLVPDEMYHLGAGDYVVTTARGDIQAVASCCEQIRNKREGSSQLGDAAQDFSNRILDLGHTAPRFVENVERVF